MSQEMREPVWLMDLSRPLFEIVDEMVSVPVDLNVREGRTFTSNSVAYTLATMTDDECNKLLDVFNECRDRRVDTYELGLLYHGRKLHARYEIEDPILHEDVRDNLSFVTKLRDGDFVSNVELVAGDTKDADFLFTTVQAFSRPSEQDIDAARFSILYVDACVNALGMRNDGDQMLPSVLEDRYSLSDDDRQRLSSAIAESGYAPYCNLTENDLSDLERNDVVL